jgi:hypothetical protein
MPSCKISERQRFQKGTGLSKVAVAVERIILVARPSCQIGKTGDPCPKLNWADTLEGVTLRADQYIG